MAVLTIILCRTINLAGFNEELNMNKLIIWYLDGVIAVCATMKEVKQAIDNFANGINLFNTKDFYSR